MNKLDKISFRVPDLERTRQFYVEKLGFSAEPVENGVLLTASSNEGQCARLEMIQGKRGEVEQQQSSKDQAAAYWKIGLTMPDVSLAVDRLRRAGVAGVSDPGQFEDVGFVSHLRDPDGMAIELLQHDFEDNFKPVAVDDDMALGQRFSVGQVTLRTDDIEEMDGFYVGKMGMKKISVQPVDKYKFTLHFYAFTEENLPKTENIVEVRLINCFFVHADL